MTRNIDRFFIGTVLAITVFAAIALTLPRPVCQLAGYLLNAAQYMGMATIARRTLERSLAR